MKNWLRKMFPGPPGGVVKKGGQFMPDEWSNNILDQLKDSMLMAGLDGIRRKEPVCPMTKQLITQTLSDLAVKYPKLSMREIINIALLDDVKDDYKLLENLTSFEKDGIKKIKSGKVTIRRTSHSLNKRNDAQDAMTYMMRGMMNAAHLANNPPIKPSQSGGCVDPGDKTGSGGG